MIRVYGIGNPLIDLNYRVSNDDIEELSLSRGIMHLIDEPRRDHILKYLGDRPMTYSPGGDCPNTIINLSWLGVKASFSGKVGRDDFGTMYEDRLKASGAVSDLGHGKGKTGSSIILVSPDGERTMNTFLGMCQEYTEQNVNRQHIAEADYLYTTGYMWDTQEQKDAVRFAISLAEGFGKAIAFDLADPFAVGRYRDDFLWLLERYVDIAFANAEEVRLLFQEQDLEVCVKRLAAMVPVCAVKDGARGSYVAVRGDIRKVAVKKVDVVDTTGAGDTYAAGFLYGLIRAGVMHGADGHIDLDKINTPASNPLAFNIEDIAEAGMIANWLGARIITRVGAQIKPEEAGDILKAIESGEHRKL